jgi:RNA-directed DNA polymerase
MITTTCFTFFRSPSPRAGFAAVHPKRFTVLRQTIRKRLQAKLNAVKAELQRRMHEPIPEQGKWLQAVVRGHIRYYGVPMNNPALALFRFQVGRFWHRALSR